MCLQLFAREECTGVGPNSSAGCLRVDALNDVRRILDSGALSAVSLNPSSNSRSLACEFLEGKSVNLCADLRCAGWGRGDRHRGYYIDSVRKAGVFVKINL